MILIAKPKKIKSTRPLARSRRTNYLWPISMARPRVNVLRFGKGQHYRGTLCTRLDLEHSWRPGMAPETAARCWLETGEDRVSFMTSDERTYGETAFNHRPCSSYSANRAYPIATYLTRGAREVQILGPRAPVIIANYGRTGTAGSIKSGFRVHARHTRANEHAVQPESREPTSLARKKCTSNTACRRVVLQYVRYNPYREHSTAPSSSLPRHPFWEFNRSRKENVELCNKLICTIN